MKRILYLVLAVGIVFDIAAGLYLASLWNDKVGQHAVQNLNGNRYKSGPSAVIHELR